MKLASLTPMSARAQRLADILRETDARSRLLAATTLLWRVALKKVLLLWRQAVTGRRAEAVRVRINEKRAAHAPSRPFLAVATTGGIGDFIVIARFLRDLSVGDGGIAFDIFSPVSERTAWAFAAVPGFNRTHHDILFEHLQPEAEAYSNADDQGTQALPV